MFSFLSKKNRETMLKIQPKPGEPFDVILGGQVVKVTLKKPSAAEELAISGFAEQAARTLLNLTGTPDPEVQVKVAAEAGCRAFVFIALYQADGKTKVFNKLDDVRAYKGKPITLDELAAITRAADIVFGVSEDEIKN